MNTDEHRLKRRMKPILHLCLSVFICGSLIGCLGKAQQAGREPYIGPTLPMYEVVQKINANNRKVPTLWASQDMEASIVDDQGKRHNEVLSGYLLYRDGHDMLIVATKDPVGRVFELGSNPDVYWMSVKIGPDTAWWGHYRNLGKPCSKEIPIRPDLIQQVLGIATINEDFNQLPAPTMRFNNDADAYMFVWNGKLPDRWVAVREVWYDRRTLLPRLVLLFDANGRVVLRAYLEKHRKVKLDNVPEDQWPSVATSYRLYFPDSGSKLSMQMTDVALTHGEGSRLIPNDRSFRFDPERTRTSKVIQLDEACGP
jgi:hypothetical protein